MRPIRAHDGGRTGTAAREGLAHNSIASWQMGLAAVLCNSEVLMQEVDIKLRRYYDSSTMRPISIVDVPTLYNGMTVLFFSERVSAALKRYPAPFELETCGCCAVSFYSSPRWQRQRARRRHLLLLAMLCSRSRAQISTGREITEAAYIYHPRERMHHVIAIECDSGAAHIDNSCTWRCSAGNQRLLDHPHVCTTLQDLAEKHLPCAMEIE
jgi:hypothetical protein